MNIINLVTDKNPFQEWLWQKFIQWRGETINGPTAFARYLGIKQQIVSSWLNGKYKPRNLDHIRAIGDKFPDVYEVLSIQSIVEKPELYDQVPQPYRDHLKDALTELTTTLTRDQIPPESPEGQRLARKIFDKHGFDVSSISIEEEESPRGTTE